MAQGEQPWEADRSTPVIERYAELARRALARPARLGWTRLIAIDGPSGAGKTHFAARLAEAFATVPEGALPPVVHVDDLLDGWDDQLSFWPRLERWVLAPLRTGRMGEHRVYDWHSGAFGAAWHPVPPAPVVLLEGFSSARQVIRPELTLAVFVTAPPALRWHRSVTRDGPTIVPHLARWRDVEHRHFAADRTAQAADLVVDGAPTVPPDPATRYVRLDR